MIRLNWLRNDSIRPDECAIINKLSKKQHDERSEP